MTNSLDFQSIKRAVKLEAVLRHYGVELRRSGKDQYRGCCPIHRGDGHDADDLTVVEGGSAVGRFRISRARIRAADPGSANKGG